MHAEQLLTQLAALAQLKTIYFDPLFCFRVDAKALPLESGLLFPLSCYPSF
jgi:hypothetical protein